jgi:urease accessory protein
MTQAGLVQMLRLASPALPIGGFSYSQGLESAVELGWITDETGAARWIGDALASNIGRFEAPLLASVARAVESDDASRAFELHAHYLASRETAELRAETLQMGYSLLRLIDGLPERTRVVRWLDAVAAAADADTAGTDRCALPLAWALAAHAFGLAPAAAVTTWLWAWADNQVMAAIKAVPLGQQAGQRLLSALSADIALAASRAFELPDQEWSNFAPGFAIASSRHETQYSRLFRS